MFLRKIGVWDNMLVLFTSDHGDMLGDHHLWRKTYAYEGSAHIPLIVRLPKAMRSAQDQVLRAVVDQPVCLQDIMPTILDGAGITVPETVDGSSLLPLIRGERIRWWRDFVHGEHSWCYSEEQEMQYLTDGRWKYIWFPRLGTEQLFDLTVDPGECCDLSGNEALSGEFLSWREKLVRVLEHRNAGLTEGNRLVSQSDRPPLVSPAYKERIDSWKLAVDG
jgi:arylsulfatase